MKYFFLEIGGIKTSFNSLSIKLMDVYIEILKFVMIGRYRPESKCIGDEISIKKLYIIITRIFVLSRRHCFQGNIVKDIQFYSY